MGTHRRLKFIGCLLFLITVSSCGSSSPEPSKDDGNALLASCEGYTQGISRPEKICGLEGYKYLHESFLRKTCGGCHFSGSRIHSNPMGDPDINIAFSGAKRFSKISFINSVENGAFVNDECHLNAKMKLHEDMMTWLDQQNCE